MALPTHRTPRNSTAARLVSILGTSVLLASCAAGSGGAPPVTGTAVVGDGAASTAAERGRLVWGEPDGCTAGVQVTLNQEAGAPASQTACGVAATDSTGLGIYVFKGIQYAATTELALRWTMPQPPQWNEISATEYGPSCPQGADPVPPNFREDCLYLNVWTPEINPPGGGKRPVMVFIHGGAFMEGSGGSVEGDQKWYLNLYDGRNFLGTSRVLGEEVVFVTLNYRLGVLGFLADPDATGVVGNFGIQDQTRALEWVKRNASLFGGDPERILIFGESAGAQSVALHLTIQQGNHQSLFQRAVMESPYAVAYMDLTQPDGRRSAQGKSAAYSKAAGCGDASTPAATRMACLRTLSVQDIVKHQVTLRSTSAEAIVCSGLRGLFPWDPVIDGQFITADPITLRTSKPVMNGSNLSESIPFLDWAPEDGALGKLVYEGVTDFLFGVKGMDPIRTTYDAQYPGYTPKQKLEQVVTDYMWTCFNHQASARATSPDVYRYHFIHHGSFPSWVDPVGGLVGSVPVDCNTSPAVCHATELSFVFGNAVNSAKIAQTFTAPELDMSSQLQRLWINFAARSDPNPLLRPAWWPRNSTGDILQIEAPASAMVAVPSNSLTDPAHCSAIWDGVGYTVSSALTALCPIIFE
jgi:para-nitrobenzyl esterase